MSGDMLIDSCVPTLLPHHRAQLKASGICDEVIRERGYRSVKTKMEIKRAGFSEWQSNCRPALLIPTHRPCGELVHYWPKFSGG